jgi:hypothetical protein
MGVYVKDGALGGGSWRQIGNGGVRVKAGNDWSYPTYVYAKPEGQGWRDTGYRGYPNPPQSIWVHDWNFGAVALGFTGPAPGGAPVSYYQLVQTDSNGNWLNTANVGGSPWGNFGVGEDGYYQFYVRSFSAAGLASAFTGPVRVRIGHSEQGYWATENRTQGWESEHLSGARNKDEPFWVGFGSDVHVTGMHWRNLRTPMSSVVSPGTNRTVEWIVFGTGFGYIHETYGTVYSGSNIDHGLGHDGNGQPWGIVARGAGWSTTGNGTYMLWCDNFWCSGTYTYQVQVYYVTRNYQDNGYW